MAAIIQSSPRPTSALPYRQPGSQRPDLRLIHGGRHAVSSGVLRRRRVLAVLAAVLLAAVVAVGAVAVGRGALSAVVPDPPAATSPSASASGAGGPTVLVRAGDTLWTIARRLQPSGDVRPLVDRLAARHGAGTLRPGERLSVG